MGSSERHGCMAGWDVLLVGGTWDLGHGGFDSFTDALVPLLLRPYPIYIPSTLGGCCCFLGRASLAGNDAVDVCMSFFLRMMS